MERVRHTVNDLLNNKFYQMPKFLFDGEFKKGLSNDAKVLYSLLKDRHELSLLNNWVNENGEVYLIFTREEMADMLGVSQPTLRKSIDQLKKLQLLEEEKMGLNRANRLYINAVTFGNTGVKNSFSPECKKLSVKNEKNFQSRVKESFGQECKNLSPNKTNINNTDFSDTESSQSVLSEKGQAERTEDTLRNQMNYDLLEESMPKEKGMLDEIMMIMVEMYDSEIMVSGQKKSKSIVRGALSKLTYWHIRSVILNYKKCETKIKKPKSYIQSALFNAAFENNLAAQNEVSLIIQSP